MGDEFAVVQNAETYVFLPLLLLSLPFFLLPPNLPPSFNLPSSSFLVFDYLAAKFLDRSRKELEQSRQNPTTTSIGKTQSEN